MELFNEILGGINEIIWHKLVLYIVLGVGILFTLWTRFCQYRALVHGAAVTAGKFDHEHDPGAISHFQALSAALSATVGLGNIGGVAVAIALGGPGAVFWMWIIGFAGMALKTTEVTLSMLYRDVDDSDNPTGGPMWVAKKAFTAMGLAKLGAIIGGIFCVTLLISTATGGNMFQAWNVAEVTHDEFRVPRIATGIILTVLVAAVILGGIKRIGAVAGKLVPGMCLLYLLASLYVLITNIGGVPDMFALILKSAFSSHGSENAFLGGTAGYAFYWGMKRALFSSEAGQGSSPIAHCAAKTTEPVREGIVAGLEPFIDTIVVCTLTSFVILGTGAWNREAEAEFVTSPTFVQASDGKWVLGAVTTVDEETLGMTSLPDRLPKAKDISGTGWQTKDQVFLVANFGNASDDTGENLHRISGTIKIEDATRTIYWDPVENDTAPKLVSGDLYKNYSGAALTAHAFNRATPGLGKWLIVLASWLFAVSTMISWSYYGEQGVIFLMGRRGVLPYKIIFCGLILLSTAGLITTDAELDGLTGLGTGVMLWANIPLMLIFGTIAMKAYHQYGSKLKAGEFKRND